MKDDNWSNKANNKKRAIAHHKRMIEKYGTYIDTGVERTIMYYFFPEDRTVDEKAVTYDTKIFVKDQDCISAIEEECKLYGFGMFVALLNFASYKEPGGRYMDGAMAQEEAICHNSVLYEVLDRCRDKFYDPNKTKLNKGLYNDNLLISPILFETETSRFNTNVITCAAPNKNAAQKYQNVSDEACEKAMKSRIDMILYSAYRQDIHSLVLGAFGCGVFGNDPKVVAALFKEAITGKYKGCFERIIFAVPKSGNKNYEAFLETFFDLIKLSYILMS